MTRVYKQTARKLYNQGRAITIVPCKLDPRNCWGLYHDIRPQEAEERIPFDKLVDNYTYYNCTAQTGYYPAYYIEQG